MTSPVEFNFRKMTDKNGLLVKEKGDWTMSFLYRNKELGPVGPTENYVYVNDSEPVTVLSFAFEGEYTFFNYNRGLKKLYRALASQNKWV